MKKYILKEVGLKKPPEYKINYGKKLNKVQLQTVQLTSGPILVIAGAGSGKTRTLVYRVARLMEDGVNPENILLLTFTRKAAQEMIRRATRLLDERCGKVSGGTFHSFSNMILRRYAKLVGFNNNFTILDRKDSEDTVGLIRTKMGFHKARSRFPHKETVHEVLSKSVNKDCPIEKILKESFPHFLGNLEDIKKIGIQYQEYKKSKSIMDYDDLLVYLEKLLAGQDEIRNKLSNFYKYIIFISECKTTSSWSKRFIYNQREYSKIFTKNNSQ